MEDIAGTSCPTAESMECNEDIQTSSNVDILTDWTKDEKFELLQALQLTGSLDIDSIQTAIPNKTHAQIKEAIDYYKKKASLHPSVVDISKRERSANGGARVPLNNWAKLLLDTVGFEALQTEIPSALRLIAELESIPATVCTEHIDFKSIYKMIANAMEGKPVPENKIAAMVIDKCIMETALCTKAFIRLSNLKYVLDTISPRERQVDVIPRHSANQEEKTVLILASQINYNPLNIPENFLKSTKP